MQSQSLLDSSLSCPRCHSDNYTKAGHQQRKFDVAQICLCHNCGLHFVVNRISPFRVAKRYSSEVKNEVAQLYLKHYKPSFIQKMMNDKYHVKPSTTLVQSIVRSFGISPPIHYLKRGKVEGVCPLCGGNYLIRYGRTRRGFQQYLCNICGTKFLRNHVCGIPKFSEKIKDFAICQYSARATLNLIELADLVSTHFGITVKSTTIRNWILKAGIPIRPDRGWTKRRLKFGSLGQPSNWLKSRREAQLKLWKNLEYIEHMRKIHRKPRHSQEIVDFCLKLHTQGLSFREVAHQASLKFGICLAHDTVSKWAKYSEN